MDERALPVGWIDWTNPRLFDRCAGAYLGLAIGDALGATVEFMTPREIVKAHGVHRHITGGGWLKLKAGQVTDDTTMSLALGEALLKGERERTPFDTGLMADAFAGWLRARPVDCGNTCRRGIQRYLRDGTLQGPPNDGDAGNGALMRNLPVIIATLGDDELCEEVSIAQARITHHHPHSDAAVLALARLTQQLIKGQTAALDTLKDIVSATPAFRFTPYPGRASAYVVDTMQTVLHHFNAFGTFEDAMIATVNQGEDADTTGALIGMLAGARCGASALPAEWVNALDSGVRQAVLDQSADLLALAALRSGNRL